MATNIGKSYVVIGAKVDQLVNGVNQANKSLGTLGLAAKRLQSNLIGMFGAYQFIGAVQNAVTTLAEFDKAMVSVKVITGATGRDFDNLTQSALRLGSTTQYTAKEVAELQLEFGRLGFSTKEINQSTKAVVDLATATGEGLARSAEIAGSTLRAFNLDASQMGRVTDVMASALNESALTLDSFADAIKYVAPVAAASNVTLEETAAMMSVLADAGIKGTQAGTSLRRIFTMLTDTGKPLQQRLDELAKSGITLAQANDEVGLYAQTALLVLTEYKSRIDALNQLFIETTGNTNDMARAMEDNLATSIVKVKTAYDSLILSFSDSKGEIKGIADLISGSLRLLASNQFASGDKNKAIFNALTGDRRGFDKLIKELNQVQSEIDEAKKSNDEFISDTALSLSKDYGDNIEGVKNAIYESARATKFYNEILKEYGTIRQKTLNDEIKALDVKKRLSDDEIKELEKKKKLLFEISEIERGARIATLERSLAGTPLTPMQNLSKGLGGGEVGKDLNAGGAKAVDAITSSYERLTEAVKKYSEASAEMAEMHKKTMTDAWMRLGAQMSDTLGQVIAADESLVKSGAKMAAQLINQLEQVAMAYMAMHAAKFGPFAIAAATAGFAIVKGLFAKISKKDEFGGGAGFNKPQVSMATTYGTQSSVVIRGQDLYVAMKNYEANNKYTKAGG
jgi:hypothetical protein